MNVQAKVRPADDASERFAQIDWRNVEDGLNELGAAVLERLLSPKECREIAALYDGGAFRSHIVMARHGFGKGEYKYFSYPLPALVESLRTALYPRLAPIANAWNARMSIEMRYPDKHREFLALCHSRGQTRPTPLLLRYETGDYNCLHQDLYGELAFPLQAAILLSEPGAGFHRRRVRDDRAAAAHAVARRGDPAVTRRRGGVRGASSAGERDARDVPREPPARHEPAAIGPAPHAGRDFPRREIG